MAGRCRPLSGLAHSHRSSRSLPQVYYVKWFMGEPKLIAAFLTTGTFCQMIGAGFASTITQKLGKVPAYILVQAIIVVGSVALYFVSSSSVWVIFILFGLVNFLFRWGPHSFHNGSGHRGIRRAQDRTTSHRTGFLGALFALKLGVAIGGWLIGLVLAYYGYDGQAESQSPEAIRGIVLSLTLFPRNRSLFADSHCFPL